MKNSVNGNTTGIRDTLLERIAGLYDLAVPQGEFVSRELLDELAALTGMIRREISVYIARDGSVRDVSLGDSAKVSMPDMRLVRNEDRLCGVRCIHTHVDGDGRLSDVDLGTLRSMRLDAMAALGVNADGEPTTFYASFIGDETDTGERQALIAGPLRPHKLPNAGLLEEIRIADDRFRASAKDTAADKPERAVLVGMENDEGYDTLEELAELARTAGAEVVGRSLQRKRPIDSATYIGSGKADELTLTASALQADVFIFDDELSAVQLRNLERVLHTRVIDRTALILDIFAKRATSREGKLQVELAMYQYNLTRLMGSGEGMSQQAGGIGTRRGPGEKKLEIDRRRIRRRIYELGLELDEIAKQRSLRRTRRDANAIPIVALVGYTNAGKSTLLNAISGAGVTAEHQLFTTLDTVVRQVTLPGGTQILVSDTVGFINKLPHDLVEAFKSTLEEATDADVILHVIDSSSSYFDSQMRVVDEVLCHLGAGDIARIDVYNKSDKEGAFKPNGDGVAISALTGDGVEALLARVERMLNSSRRTIDVLVPYDRYEAAAFLRSDGRILEETHEADGTRIRAQLDESSMWKLKKLLGGGETGRK